jgi:protein-tyrosine phosphatase
MQITGGSLLGQFGRRARALAERMLEDGLVHIIASDAHDTKNRPPILSDALAAAASRIGEDEALHLVSTRPAGILKDVDPSELPPPVRIEPVRGGRRSAWAQRN